VSLLFTGSGKPLSKPLSYKERGFEFSPFRATRTLASSILPPATKAKHPFSSPLVGG